MTERKTRLSPQVEITYYTDPLCSWSWGFEPQWRRLRYEFAGQITWQYKMAGMLPDWQSYDDPINVVSRPAQMGPQWFQVRHVSGMPIDERIWREDPPASSYPACLAFKAAQRQGDTVAERYLRRLREAVMVERRNIARRNVLLELAAELAEPAGSGLNLNLAQFEGDLASQATLDAFRSDLQEVAYRGIGRFPTLFLRGQTMQPAMVVGYRPYSLLLDALAAVAPRLLPSRLPANMQDYVVYWGHITARELAEAFEIETDSAQRALDLALALA